VYKKHGAFYLVTPAPEQKWIRLGSTKAEMYKALAVLEIQPSGGYTVESLWKDYSQDELPKKSPATQAGYRKSSTQLLKVFGHLLLDQIGSPDVAKYLLIRGKKAPTCANQEIGLLSTMYTYAVALGLAERNPCLRVKRHKLSPRDRLVEDWELDEFRKECSDQLDCYCELKELTGLRMTDMLFLTLANIKEDGLYVRPSKTQNSTGERREFIWTPELKAVIDRIVGLPRPQTETRLFVNKDGKPFMDEELQAPRFGYLWRKTMKAALLKTELREPFQEKDIRAKTASDADRLGQDATAILGHEDSRTTRRYIRHKQIKRVMPLVRKAKPEDAEDTKA
jgi:integrase